MSKHTDITSKGSIGEEAGTHSITTVNESNYTIIDDHDTELWLLLLGSDVVDVHEICALGVETEFYLR